MTFSDFCEAIGDGVLSCVPGAKYQHPRERGDPAVVSLGQVKALITREKLGWRVAMSRPDGAPRTQSLAGETVNAPTAERIAGAIAGFLI